MTEFWLIDLCTGGEDVPADLGQADGGHHTHQQPLREQQVQHPWPQGQSCVSPTKVNPPLSSLVSSGGFSLYFRVFCLSQVGTLDVLVGLSDELAKLDTFVER